MADLVLRLDLGTDQLLDADDEPDRRKIARVLRHVAQQIAEGSGPFSELDGKPIAVRGSLIPAGNITIDNR